MKTILATLCALLCLAPPARAQADEAAARAEVDRLNASASELFSEGKFEEALEPARRALKLGEKTFGDRAEVVAVSLNNLAKVYAATGKAPDAEKLYRRALVVYEKLFAPDDIRVAAVLDGLGHLAMAGGKDPGRAVAYFTRALEIRQKVLGGEHDELLLNAGNLASAYSAKGEPAKVETLLKYIAETRERALAAGDPRLGAALHNYACFLRRYGRGEEAAKLEERAFGSLPEQAGAEPIKVPSGVALCRATAMETPDLKSLLFSGVTRGGTVRVELVVDEAGKVVSAKALDGPTELRTLSAQAASRTRFAPLLIKGKAVAFSTVITYSHGPLSRVEDIGVRIY